jgi:hypothetical protein
MNEMTSGPPAFDAAAREIRASLKPGETMSFVSHYGHYGDMIRIALFVCRRK